ncbi:MAG: ABC transporter ATP-binding protein [Lachnospiraceae bacterium]|nr:ABC transporter ATP-binding protein [Lachnospiraceae bacterium]
MNTIRELMYLLDRKAKLQTVWLLILIIIGSVAELLGVSILLPIINLAMNDEAMNSDAFVLLRNISGLQTKEHILLLLIMATVIIYITKSVYLSWMYGKMYYFAADVKRGLATKLMRAYLEQPYSFFLYRNTSELIRGVNADTAQLYEVITNCLLILSNGFTALCLVGYLAVTNIIMTIVVAGLLAVCGAAILLIVQKRTRYYGKVNQTMSSFLIRHLQQAFDGIKEIKILNNEKYFIDQYDVAYYKQTDVVRKSKLVNLIPKYLIEAVCISGILTYLAVNILWNPTYITLLPQLAVFCVTAYKLLPSVNSIYAYTNTIVYHKASIDLVYNDVRSAEQLTKAENFDIEQIEKMSFVRDICVNNITFAYENTNKNVLEHAEMYIVNGQSVALVGPSGGGKTTMADILLGLLEPKTGQILVDGKDIRENLSGWRQNIGYIPQNIYLTDDTIRNNVAFGIAPEKISDEQVWKVLRDAQLEEFIRGLEKGLDTEVGERGVRISGGQRQRIGIARALYRNPDILIFDEATSALDNETEKELMKSIDGLHGTKTMVMIAHRLSTIENCDVVYKIEAGKVERIRG